MCDTSTQKLDGRPSSRFLPVPYTSASCPLRSDTHQAQRKMSQPNTATRENSNAPLIASFNAAKARYLLHELRVLRNELIGSPRMIALVRRGAPPEALCQALSPEAKSLHDAYVILVGQVAQVALADTILRQRGELPSAPRSPSDVAAEIKASKPDWQALWDYVDYEHSSGFLADDPAWGAGWRDRLEKALAETKQRFGECDKCPLGSLAASAFRLYRSGLWTH